MVFYPLGTVVGSDGNGIESIELIDTTGLVKTYRINFTDGDYFDYQVTDGEDGGSADIVTSWESTLSDTKVPSEKLTKNSIDAKQDSLVSGTNIKTVNNESLLGSGNITIQGEVGTFTDLQSLITSASSGDVITLDKDYKYDSTTDSSLTTGIVIDKNLTINANGHIIDGNTSARAFTITGSSNNKYTVTLNNITIQKCKSPTNSDGGAIYISSYVTLQINDSLITQNTSTKGGGAIGAYSHCNVYITNSTFTHNTATDGFGGAILNTNYGDTKSTNSLFTNNTTNGRGGVLYGATSSNTIIDNSILTSNTASEGGALSFRNLGVNNGLKMSGTSVYGNTASSSSNIYCNASITVYNCKLPDASNTYTNIVNKPYLPEGSDVSNLVDANAHTNLGTSANATQSTINTAIDSGKEDKTNKVTTISSSSTDTEYPSAKLLYDQIQAINSYINLLANFTLTTTPQIISYYHNQTATLTATLLKGNGNGVTGETIKFYKDNTELTGTVTDNGDGTYTYTLPSNNTGLHTLQAKNDILTTDNITLLDASYYDDTTTDKHTDYYNITTSGVYVTYNDGYYTLSLGTGNNYVDMRKELDINGKTVSFSVDVVLNGASVRLRAFHSGGTPIKSSSYTTNDGTITLEDIEIPSDATGTIFRLERRYTTDGDYIQFKNFKVYVTP